MSNITKFEPQSQHPQNWTGSLQELERMAHAIAKSGLFGMKSPEQAIALMLLAQAEGFHPVTAARDYHIIQGRPSKKPEAMQRDFLAQGGTIKWNILTDLEVSATFSHPLGGEATISWDMARAKQAGLGGKENWQKWPRQMLRSRVISEGCKTVFPAATGGLYTPEEVQDFEPVNVTPVKVGPPPPKQITQPPRVKGPEERHTEAEIMAVIDDLNERNLTEEARLANMDEAQYFEKATSETLAEMAGESKSKPEKIPATPLATKAKLTSLIDEIVKKDSTATRDLVFCQVMNQKALTFDMIDKAKSPAQINKLRNAIVVALQMLGREAK